MRERYHLLDALRGLTVVSMAAYHFAFDLFILQGWDPQWRSIPAVHVWQQSICWTFLLLAGVSFHLGRRRWRGGLILSLLGAVVTAVTVAAAPSEAIFWGVLSLHGAALLLASALEPVLRRIPPKWGSAVSFGLFALTYDVQIGVIGLPGRVLFRLPAVLYRWSWLAPLGFPGPGFCSSDYFPLLPWFFLYLTGYWLGKLLLRDPPRALYRTVPGLDWVGRHSLLIYMLHQPAALAAAWAIAQAAGRG